MADTMAIEGLTRSGAIRFLLSLGAHARLQEDRLSQKLDAIDAKLDQALGGIDRLDIRG